MKNKRAKKIKEKRTMKYLCNNDIICRDCEYLKFCKFRIVERVRLNKKINKLEEDNIKRQFEIDRQKKLLKKHIKHLPFNIFFIVNCTSLQCDNRECNHIEENIWLAEWKNYIGYKCPKCGENMLTKYDARNFLALAFKVSLVYWVYLFALYRILLK